MEKKLGKKILIVEDEVPMLNVLTEKFKQQEFEVLQAKDGEKGLELATQKKPDLILLDIILPKMDGMTMLKKLRKQSKWGRAVPVILLTNLTADDQMVSDVAQTEPSYYLVKSDWKIEDVVKKVKERLGM